MGDVNIIIKDGHIVGVDGEEGDDSDLDGISGSGETELDTTTPGDHVPYLTPTSKSNSNLQKSSTPKETDLIPYIVAGVAGVVILILVVLFIVYCLRKRTRRRKTPYEKPNRVVYSPNGCGDAGGGVEGYSVAIPLTIGEPPMEDAPPPPVPASAPPMPPGLSASGGSTSSQRYTPLGGRKGISTNPMPSDDEKNNIYEAIDDSKVSNVYEDAKPPVPKSDSGRRPRILSSVGEDPNMGSEKDKMLPPSSPV